jgi:hypothetical protein
MELILTERAYGSYGVRHWMECSYPEKGDFASAPWLGPNQIRRLCDVLSVNILGQDELLSDVVSAIPSNFVKGNRRLEASLQLIRRPGAGHRRR